MTTAHAMSVTGPVPVHDLGITLMHEHLFIDLGYRYEPPSTGEDPRSLEFGKRREAWLCNPRGDLHNLVRPELDDALDELAHFRQHDGDTIVDVTTEGIGPNRAGLRAASERSGVTIIASTGYYTHETHTRQLHDANREQLAEEMQRDLLEGDESGVRSGFIGELGVDAFEPCEIEVVCAAALAQQRTGASVGIHTLAGAIPQVRPHVVKLVRAFMDVGGDPTRLILYHQDGTGDDPVYQATLLREGVVLSYDTFGFETSFTHASAPVRLPSDDRRVREVLDLWLRGAGHQLVLSQDVCYRMMTRRAGGWGIAHVLERNRPQFEMAGLSTSEWRQMVELTPRRLLTIDGLDEAQPTLSSTASATTSTSASSSSG